ncbi:MAG: hypothetical protein LQ339_003381 [Xanthoria mediterranea]|nr:MAG: hypothetical protein LQ339_003381 [Xanthoria mediterranea]
MGISGLLPLLKSIHNPCNLNKFAGQTIGVDAYGWLHRGTVACAIDLALGKPTTKFVDFSLGRVRMLIDHGVTPYLVFDGDYLPTKAATEHERATKREGSKKLGLELYRLGKISQAHLELQKAVDVTPEMARQLIDELKISGVQYVVAPYEADAQLAYLEKKGVIQGILSEDSDLLVFGAQRLLTKLDQYGECIEINRNDFTSCREISLVGWTDADFRRMAILSGCDYLANINKMGLKTAYRLVRKHKKIEKILRMLQFDGQYYVPAGYLEAFQRAELTFLHQRVFCPDTNSVVMMTPPGMDSHDHDLGFLGAEIEQDVARGVARGDLHPMTKKPIVARRSISQLPRTPWNNTRGQTVGTRSDLKSNKSIDVFFKAQRTPLAELDPNSFTPSPSQRRLLQQQSGSWASSPAPVRPDSTRSSASVPESESASSTVRVALGTNISSDIVSQLPKKRRLCSDPNYAEKPSQLTDTPTERSRFFTASVSNKSPLVKSSKRNRARKTTDFNIWSDDSIEDAMAELTDMSQRQASPRRNVRDTIKDSDGKLGPNLLVSEACVEDPQSVSQSSTASGSNVQSEVSTCTSATSVSDAANSQPLVASSLDAHVQCDLASLRKASMYQLEPERCRVQRLEIAKISAPLTGKPALHGEGSMTPLQRLGATALKRSYTCSTSLHRLTASQDRPRIQHRSSRIPVCRDVSGRSPAQENTLAKDVGLVRGGEDTTPSDIDDERGEQSVAPRTASILIRDDTPVKGSEDAMVPNSEAESDEAVSNDGRETTVLELGQFAFTG